MIDSISNALSSVTRSLAFIPGMYFVTRPLYKLFSRHYSTYGEKAWRIISLNGYKIKVNLSYKMGSLIYWRGAHEWAPMFLIQKELKKGMVVYDIGANIGEISLFCANILGEDAKVYSFEPMKDTYETLTQNVAINKFENRIKPFNIALSDRNGEADLFGANEVDEELGTYEDGFHTLYARDARSILLYKIKLETLDSKQGELSPPDFIKIDVEGAELMVLKGAVKTLEKHHPKLMLEYSDTNCKAAGYDRHDLVDFLKPLGYKFYSIENRGKLISLETANDIPDFANLYCV
jgi:FkbM family methyltransferase